MTSLRTVARGLGAIVAALALTGGTAAVANAGAGGVPTIALNTGQEADVVRTGASGSFSYTVSDDQICYVLSARGLSAPAVAAHVHVAPRGVAGPVVVPLEVGAGTEWTVESCTAASAELLAAIEANPRAYYVNVHTPDYPAGEIRGQLK